MKIGKAGFWRNPVATVLTGILTVGFGLVLIDSGRVFSAAGFARRAGGGCSGWTAPLGLLHNSADLLIFLAYLAIPAALWRFGTLRKDLPGRYHWVLMSFVGFITACGATHLMSVVTYYWPAYRLDAAVKWATVVFSWATVTGIAYILPEAIRSRGSVADMLDVAALKEAEGNLVTASLTYRVVIEQMQAKERRR